MKKVKVSDIYFCVSAKYKAKQWKNSYKKYKKTLTSVPIYGQKNTVIYVELVRVMAMKFKSV